MAIEERTITMLVNNQPGVLSRIAGVFSSRGYNITSLSVAETVNPEVSRITLTSRAEGNFTETIKRYLDRLIDVIRVFDYTGPAFVQRELMLLGVALRPEHRTEILRAIELFHGRIIATEEEYLVLEFTGSQSENAGILRFFQTYGVEEMNRTGAIAMRRGGGLAEEERVKFA